MVPGLPPLSLDTRRVRRGRMSVGNKYLTQYVDNETTSRLESRQWCAHIGTLEAQSCKSLQLRMPDADEATLVAAQSERPTSRMVSHTGSNGDGETRGQTLGRGD
jgi:hypothetical protein